MPYISAVQTAKELIIIGYPPHVKSGQISLINRAFVLFLISEHDSVSLLA